MPDVTHRFQLLPVLCILALATSSSAQTIAIRLVNGDTGKPFTNQNVNVTFWWEDPASPNKDKRTEIGSQSGIDVYIDKTGIGHIEIPSKATLLAVREGSKIGKEPDRIAYADCNGQMPSLIPIADVLEHGFIPGNSCNKNLKVKVSPGEVVYLGKPIPWWMPDMQ